MSGRRIVILDKNFVQSEGRTTPRLNALARCGCEFVLIDTLIYELCSDRKLPTLWQSVQRKLFPFADRLRVWHHTSELLRKETVDNKPVSGPEDEEATQRFWDWFRSGTVYLPSDAAEIVEAAHQQREIDSMEKVAPMARAVGALVAEARRHAGIQGQAKEDLAGWVRDNLTDERLIRWALRASHGDPESRENHIPDAAGRVTPDWFAYRNARVTLALIAVFLQKYGLTNAPGRKFPNTKLDTDFLALLHYADALASDETSGDMADMCTWLFGSTRKRITSAKLLSSVPSETDIRYDAYCRWEATGRGHGHDVDDWLTSESELYETIWTEV